MLSSFALRGFVRDFPAVLQRPTPEFEGSPPSSYERALWGGHFATAQGDRTRTQAPFVPHIGPLVLSRKNLPRHADFHWKASSFFRWPPLPGGAWDFHGYDDDADEGDAARQRDHGTFVDLDRRRDLDALALLEDSRTDYASKDESVWHVPLSVEASPRVLFRWPRAASVPRQLTTAGVRLHIHLFPYGLCTVFICIPVTSRGRLPLEELIVFLRQVGGLRVPPPQRAAYKLLGQRVALPAADFADAVAQRVADALYLDAEPSDLDRVAQFHVISTSDFDLTEDRQVRGLLSLDERFPNFSPDFSSVASLYGKMADDLVVASSGGLLVKIPRVEWERSAGKTRSRELHYTWRLIHIMEFARSQKSLFPVIERTVTRLLQRSGGGADEESREIERLLRVADHLSTFHRGFPAHHRKWYYKCQEVLGLERMMPGFGEKLRSLVQDAEMRDVLREAVKMERVRIEIGPQAQVGTINLGRITGNIENQLNQMSSPEDEELRTALKSIAEAIVKDREIGPEAKAELLENVEFLSESALQQPEERKTGLITRVLDGLSDGLAAATAAGQVWLTWAPIVGRYFGMS